MILTDLAIIGNLQVCNVSLRIKIPQYLPFFLVLLNSKFSKWYQVCSTLHRKAIAATLNQWGALHTALNTMKFATFIIRKAHSVLSAVR